jgi:4-amino-4-deoxy-L-arabinose transferase-like glycosyltransferase
VVAATFVGLALTVAIATPPWEANDEQDHARNVETLRRGDWYRITPDSGLESNQPPLYYAGLAGYAWLIGVPANPTRPASRVTVADVLENPGLFRHDVRQDERDASYLRRLRIPSVALGLAAVLLAAATAVLVTLDRWTPVVAAATCAFVPKFVFVSGVVNNDNLANALGALAVFLSVLLATRSTPRNDLWVCLALGVTVGAMVLTKASTFLLLPGVAVALVLAARREPDTFRGLARRSAVTVGTVLIVAGWWLGLTTHWYGDPVAANANHDHYAEVAPFLVDGAGSARALFVELPKTFWDSYWYRSGWNQLQWSAWAVVPFWSLLAAGLAGLARRGQHSTPTGTFPTLAVLTLGGPAAVFALATTTNTAQGRIAFVSLVAVATLYALGVERLRVPVWARFALPLAGLVGTAVAIRQDVFVLYG